MVGVLGKFETRCDRVDSRRFHRSQFLKGWDSYGEYAEALKKKGIKVVARIEVNWTHREVLEERPNWFERDAEGEPVHNREADRVYSICTYALIKGRIPFDFVHEEDLTADTLGIHSALGLSGVIGAAFGDEYAEGYVHPLRILYN